MKTDGRVRYTRMVIKESLLKLLTNKPIQKVTVTEICELAQINRATFYTHYRDAFDLLEQIEDELFAELSATIITKDQDPDRLTKEILRIIERNIELCRILFSENGDKMFLRRIIDSARERTIGDWHRQYPRATPQQLDLLYTFIAGGSVAMIEQWVRTGMQGPPLDLGGLASKVSESWLGTGK
jgi:AcrR family transcriptional regulator